MRVSTKLNDDKLFVYLEGEIDQSVADVLRVKLDKLFEEAGARSVILMLGKLTFMDSTGIGLIMGRYKKLKKKNIPMFICGPSKQIDKVLRVSGIYGIIPLIER